MTYFRSVCLRILRDIHKQSRSRCTKHHKFLRSDTDVRHKETMEIDIHQRITDKKWASGTDQWRISEKQIYVTNTIMFKKSYSGSGLYDNVAFVCFVLFFSSLAIAKILMLYFCKIRRCLAKRADWKHPSLQQIGIHQTLEIKLPNCGRGRL